MEQKKQTEILQKLKSKGLERDFKELYHLLYDRFFRIAIYYLKKDEWSQEVVLDVFFTLWNKRRELSDLNKFDSYCFILLKNAALNYLSKINIQYVESFEDEKLDANTESSPEERMLNEELLLVYVRALDDLPPKCREVFVLIREQGLNYKEVASQLNISVKTVDAQLQKALQKLKGKIKEYLM